MHPRPVELAPAPPCRICGAATAAAGVKRGAFRHEVFQLRQCPSCRFAFVANPWTDYSRIYDDAYYSGRGADPLVDYLFELEQPGATIRRYEWLGIHEILCQLVPVNAATEWLDFGCGNGGLVRYLSQNGVPRAVGFEKGWMAGQARRAGIPIVAQADLDGLAGTMDVVTAIEVIEHVEDPIAVLQSIRALLKPGGVLFLTTGNAANAAGNLPAWNYVIPEIHISFFEPQTLAAALRKTGFQPVFRGYLPGFTNVIRFKVLKNLRIRRHSHWQGLIPWGAVSRLLNTRFQVTGHPIGVAQ